MATIKQNIDDDSTELWIGGKLRASWKLTDIPNESKGVVENMIRCGIEHGERLKMKEVRKVIGV
jgi:hypothetical protein